MTDTNRPIGFKVIDTRDDNHVVQAFPTHDEASAFCEMMEAIPDDRGWRYIIEPIRPHAMAVPPADRGGDHG